MNDAILYIGLALMVFGVLKYIRMASIFKANDTVVGEVTKVKEKTKKGKSYSYPKVMVLEDGIENEFYCYSARVSGHDTYVEGEKILLYRYRKLKGNFAYITKSHTIDPLFPVIGGVVLVIYYFFAG